MEPALKILGALALLAAAAGALLLLAAYLLIRRRLPADQLPYADPPEVFTFYAFQRGVSSRLRRLYLAGLGLMTAAPFLGLSGAIAASRSDLVWPFLVLCAIGSLTTFVVLRRGLGPRDPLP